MAKKEKTVSSVFFNGILNENPTLRLVLGICPTLASTTSAYNAVGMGLAATFVLVGSNVVISLLRNIIPDKIRIPAFVVIICTFVTLVEMLVKAFVPALYASLGMFIPLIVVNCIILARAEAFASKNGVLLTYPGENRPDAQASVTCRRLQLFALMTGQQAGQVQITGDATVLKRLLAYASKFEKTFNVIEP